MADLRSRPAGIQLPGRTSGAIAPLRLAYFEPGAFVDARLVQPTLPLPEPLTPIDAEPASRSNGGETAGA